MLFLQDKAIKHNDSDLDYGPRMGINSVQYELMDFVTNEFHLNRNGDFTQREKLGYEKISIRKKRSLDF